MRDRKFRVFSKIQQKMIYENNHPYSISKIELSYQGFATRVYVLFERKFGIEIKGYLYPRDWELNTYAEKCLLDS